MSPVTFTVSLSDEHMILLTNIRLWELAILHGFNPRQTASPRSLQYLCPTLCPDFVPAFMQLLNKMNAGCEPDPDFSLMHDSHAERLVCLHLFLSLLSLSPSPMQQEGQKEVLSRSDPQSVTRDAPHGCSVWGRQQLLSFLSNIPLHCEAGSCASQYSWIPSPEH